jgi:hypothetical protein
MDEQHVEVNNVLFDLITDKDKFKRYDFNDRSSLPGKSTNRNIKEASTTATTKRYVTTQHVPMPLQHGEQQQVSTE